MPLHITGEDEDLAPLFHDEARAREALRSNPEKKP